MPSQEHQHLFSLTTPQGPITAPLDTWLYAIIQNLAPSQQREVVQVAAAWEAAQRRAAPPLITLAG